MTRTTTYSIMNIAMGMCMCTFSKNFINQSKAKMLRAVKARLPFGCRAETKHKRHK